MTAFALFSHIQTSRKFFSKVAVLSAVVAVMLLSGSPVAAETGTNGPRVLTISQATNLDPNGATVAVSGSGYDTEKGVYIAFCRVPPAGSMPTPCGGGADVGGVSGSSIWISSNPPAYGVGVAIPYGDGGTFSATMAITPVINANTDCRVVQCAIVTRSDHTKLSDRSQDVIIPVTFAVPATPTPIPPVVPTQAPGQPAPTATPVPPTATPSPTATTPATAVPPTPTPAPPVATVSADGRSATAGAMQLTASAAKDLASGVEVKVSGSGFDPAQGVYVALCALPAGKAPGPCTSGATNVAAWISSNPPDYGRDRAVAYGAGGSFEVTLKLNPIINTATDCRTAACGITTRADDTSIEDRTRDLAIPVTFSTVESTPAVSPTSSPAASAPAISPAAVASPTVQALSSSGSDDSDDGGPGNPQTWAIVGGLIAAVLGAVVLFGIRKAAMMNMSVIAIVAMLLGACSGDSGPGESTPAATVPIVVAASAPAAQLPVTVVSADGREVTITDTSRIVSLWGNLTEIVFGLGLGENVVGRDISATFPEAANLPLVTRAHDVSAEGVLSLKPTLVLASKDNSGPSTALDHIRNVGIPVVVFDDPTSVDDIIPRISAVANALGVPTAGDSLAAEVRSQLAATEAAAPNSANAPKVAFLYLRGQAGVYLLGGPKSGADSMFRAVGGVVAGTALGLSVPFTPITSEALAKAAPDVILMTQSGLDSVGGIDGLVNIPGIAQTPAGKNRRVITMDDALLYSFGARTPEALRTLSTLLFGTASAVSTATRNP